MTALGSGEGVGGHLQGVQILWTPPGDGDLLLTPGAGDLGGRQLLAGAGMEFITGEGGTE